MLKGKMKMTRNDQENFWSQTYSKDYIKKNSNFDNKLLFQGWEKLLAKIENPLSILECGANIGRNIKALDFFLPNAKKSAIEISSDAAEILKKNYPSLNIFNQSILESSFQKDEFDFVFTMTVLIHINPKDLNKVYKNMYNLSKKFILIAEYFSQDPVVIKYRGKNNLLFKRDFAKEIKNKYNLKIVDYGFIWSEDKKHSLDNFNWFILKK